MNKNGWNENERAILKKYAAEAQKNGEPLKAVFEKTARETGRKPDSVRNYYYKENINGASTVFKKFSDNETEDMLFFILKNTGEGRSVRSCCLELGGDKKGMLRFQNKFRTILKKRPDTVKKVINELKREDAPALDSFENEKKALHAGPLKKDILQLCRSFVETDEAKRIELLPRYIYELRGILYK